MRGGTGWHADHLRPAGCGDGTAQQLQVGTDFLHAQQVLTATDSNWTHILLLNPIRYELIVIFSLPVTHYFLTGRELFDLYKVCLSGQEVVAIQNQYLERCATKALEAKSTTCRNLRFDILIRVYLGLDAI